MPVSIQTVLQGYSLSSNLGSFAFCGITLIKGTKTTLVDTGHVGRRSILTERLKALGYGVNDIDQVVLTHAHWDHSLNIDVFPNAEILLHSNEREYVRNPKAEDYATPRYVSAMLESSKLREVHEGEEIDDGVRVLSTPGHSKGSLSLLVEQADGAAAVCGDALPNSLSVASHMPRLVFWNVEDAQRSIRTLLERAQAFYPGHDRPFRVDGSRIHYLQPAEAVRIIGWPVPGEGEGGGAVTYQMDPPAQAGVHA